MEPLPSSSTVPAMASSPPSPPRDEGAAVCCMCGDHGLARELFRCRCCRARLQHRYCSDLYPRATAYRRCNWCLIRAPPPPAAQGGGGTAAGHASSAVAAKGNKPSAGTKRKEAATVSDEERQRHEGCAATRSRPPAGLGCLVKKKRKADERAPDGDGEGNKELMRAGKPRVRVKVRRYRLLAEVISC